MRSFTTILLQAVRNLRLSWKSQLMTFFTVLLSVLIFSFFYLTYTNALQVGNTMGNDLRLVVYLDESPPPALQDEYRRRILKFDQVERIVFVDQNKAYERFAQQLDATLRELVKVLRDNTILLVRQRPRIR